MNFSEGWQQTRHKKSQLEAETRGATYQARFTIIVDDQTNFRPHNITHHSKSSSLSISGSCLVLVGLNGAIAIATSSGFKAVLSVFR